MKVIATEIPDVLVIEPQVLGDDRGFFIESFNVRLFREATGLDVTFVQDNHSRSLRGVLRGLHYQRHQPQGKLVRVVSGSVFSVAVDVRRSSPTFGHWVGATLDDVQHRQLWLPAGFAHGFLVLGETADVVYKTSDYYAPQHERSIAWNDATIGIDWPLREAGVAAPILSARDRAAVALTEADLFP